MQKKKDRKFANPFCLARIASDLTHSEGAALIQRCAKMHTCQKKTPKKTFYTLTIYKFLQKKLALASYGFNNTVPHGNTILSKTTFVPSF